MIKKRLFLILLLSITYLGLSGTARAVTKGMVTVGPGLRKLKEDNFKSSWPYSGEISFVYISGDQNSAIDSLATFLWVSAGCHVLKTDNSEINKYVYYGEIGIYNIGFGYTREISDIDYYHLFVGLPLPIPVSNTGFLPYVMLYMRRGWGREDRSQKFKEYGIMAKIGFEVL